MGAREPVFSDKNISFFILAFLLSISFVALLFANFACKKDLFDYLAYALPCASGILAGGAIISPVKSSERGYYLGAVALLILGFLCYLASHINPVATVLLWLIFLSGAAVVALAGIAITKDYTGNTEGLWVTVLVALLALLVIGEFFLVATHIDALRSASGTLC